MEETTKIEEIKFHTLPESVKRMMTSVFSYEDLKSLSKIQKDKFSWIDIAEYTFPERRRPKTESKAEEMCKFLSNYASSCTTCDFDVSDDSTAVFYTRDRKCLNCMDAAENPIKQPCIDKCKKIIPIDADLINPIAGKKFSRDLEKCEKCGCVSYADLDDDNSNHYEIEASDDDDLESDLDDSFESEDDVENICRLCSKSFDICECSEDSRCKTCNGPCKCERCHDCDSIMEKIPGDDAYFCKTCKEDKYESSDESDSDEDEEDDLSGFVEFDDNEDIKSRMRSSTKKVREKSERKAEKRKHRQEKSNKKRRCDEEE